MDIDIIEVILNKDMRYLRQYDKIGYNLIYFNGNDNVFNVEGYICYINNHEIIFDINDILDGKDYQYKKNEATILVDKERVSIPYYNYDKLVEESFLFERETDDDTIKEVVETIKEFIKD